MLEVVQEYVGLIASIVALLLSLVTIFLKLKNSKSAGTFDAIKWALKALPGFITFSETINADASGAEKKAYVMEQITNNFAIMGVAVDESVLSEIGDTIDKIVAATKRLHTVAKGVTENENQRNDIGTITGLRAGT